MFISILVRTTKYKSVMIHVTIKYFLESRITSRIIFFYICHRYYKI